MSRFFALCGVSAMALEVVGYAERSLDGRVRALLSHGPITGRLAASEPNVQQWPRDQLFRAMCMSYLREGRQDSGRETKGRFCCTTET